MRKLLLSMTALLSTMGAMADVTNTFVTRNFTLLTAEQFNAVTTSRRFAIECTQVTNANTLYNGNDRTSAISSTVMPENVVYEWVKVEGEDNFYIKKAGSEDYLTTANIRTFAGKDAANVAKFKALPVSGNISDTSYGSEDDKTYYLRLALSSSNYTTWFNFNGMTYNSGTGVWTVQHILDLSEYYKLTMTIQKGEETTTSVVYVKAGDDIVAPDYTEEGYRTNYVSESKTADDNQTVTIAYFLDQELLLRRFITIAQNKLNSISVGTEIGACPQASYDAFSSAVATANEVLNSGNVTEADVAALQAAIDGLTRNMPEPGKFYQLATWKAENAGKVAFAKTDNKCYWGMNDTPAAVWVFEAADNGAYYLKNLATGSYMDNYTGSAGGANVLIEKDETKTVAVAVADDGRKVGIKVGSNNIYLDRDQYNPDANGSKPVCHWTDNAIPAGDNRKWLINEVSASDIKHTLSVGATGWATLVLGFNVTIPTTEGVTVYAVESTSATEATLTPVTGVLPANTAVLVNAPAGTTVDFFYTAETATVSSLMTGTLYDKNITPEDGQTCYVLAMPADATEPAFCKATLNQANNAAFKNNANKAYLPVATTSAGAPSLNFVFGTETSIEGVAAANAGKSAVYDLSGRRVKSAVKGIYIINGKKVVK